MSAALSNVDAGENTTVPWKSITTSRYARFGESGARGTEGLRYLGLRETKDFAKRKYAAEWRTLLPPALGLERSQLLFIKDQVARIRTRLVERNIETHTGALAIRRERVRGRAEKWYQGGRDVRTNY